MEIERKFLIKDLNSLPFHPEDYPHRELEQGYLCTEPVVRIRKDADQYFLTYKSKGLMVREEYNLPLTEDGYLHLKEKVDGRLITKTRYVIPLAELESAVAAATADSESSDAITAISPETSDLSSKDCIFTSGNSENLYLELDIFHGDLAPLVLAEIEFPDENSANSYCPPEWLNEEVTHSSRYHNSTLSQM